MSCDGVVELWLKICKLDMQPLES